jgi:hypothetical protein
VRVAGPGWNLSRPAGFAPASINVLLNDHVLVRTIFVAFNYVFTVYWLLLAGCA